MKKKIRILALGILLGNIQPTQWLQAQTLTANFSAVHRPVPAAVIKDDTSTKPLKEVLKYLRKNRHVNFIYEDKLVQNRTVSIDENTLRHTTIEQLLQQLLTPLGLEYVSLSEGNFAIITRMQQLPALRGANASRPLADGRPFDSGSMNQAYSASLSPIAVHLKSPNAREIGGRVISAKTNTPLEGVTVTVKGSSLATYTNSNGTFLLTIPDNAEILVFRYLGYKEKEVAIGKSAFYTVALELAVKGLNEVVVNGIYERPLSNYTGAARSFTAAQLEQVGNKNVLDALKSMDPSFRIPENLQFGSDPNHLPDIQMRGANSLQDLSDKSGPTINLRGDYMDNPNLPLFILDGFQVSLQKIYDLDMNRIAKVTLLKDAAATAIYGSKAANGVVVIDTKQPERGKLRLTYSGNFTVTAPDLSSYHLLNARQKLQLEKAGGIYHGENAGDENQLYLDELYNQRLKEVQRGVNTYWLSQPLRTAFGQKHGIYLEGGDNIIRYGIDAAYNNDNNGVMKGSGRTTYSGGAFLSYRHKNLLFRNSIEITSNHAVNSPYGSFDDYSKLNPYWRVRDSSGNIPRELEVFQDFYYSNGAKQIIYNPMYRVTLHSKNFSKYLNVTDNFQVEWQITDPLKLKGQFSFYNQKSHFERFISGLDNAFADGYDGADYFRRGNYTVENGNEFNYQGTVTLNYGKAFGKNVLYATGGMQLADDNADVIGLVAEGFPNDRLDDITFANQYQKNGKPYGNENFTRSIGFLANASYAYDNRYLLDASFRMDGSSKFGTDKRFAPFWSVGAGWNVEKEKFMKAWRFVDRFKLRASYGATGSQQFPSYMALTTYQYKTDQRYRTGVGATLMALGNPALQWEQTYKTDIGADFMLFNNRISLGLDYYVERSKGLITSITTPPSLGFQHYNANLGTVQNKGVEAFLTAYLVRNEKKGFFWSVNADIFHDKNKILKISDALKQQNQNQIDKQQDANNPLTAPVILYKEGQSQNTIYAVRSKGIDPSTGQEIFVKKDGSLTYTWDPADEVPVGNSDALIYGTFGTNFMYKGFSVNIAFRTNAGGQLYNQTLANRVENANLLYNVDYRVLAERWQQPGDDTPFKGLVKLNGTTRHDYTKATSRFVQDNNILYCDAITLGYELPQQLVSRWSMSRLQTYFYINRPFVVSSIKQERGLAYPFARTFSLSLQATF